MNNPAPSFAERLAFQIKRNPARTSSPRQRQAVATATERRDSSTIPRVLQ